MSSLPGGNCVRLQDASFSRFYHREGFRTRLFRTLSDFVQRILTRSGAALYRNFSSTLKSLGLFERPFRISPRPVVLPGIDLPFLDSLGRALLSFYRAFDRLYREPAPGLEFVRDYLDRGKPPELLSYGLARRFKNDIPGLLRPDLLLTSEGPVLTEMDAVPGGPGLLLAISRLYRDRGYSGMIGGAEGILDGFASMIASRDPDPVLAIVVSDESGDYRNEMALLAADLSRGYFPAFCLHPRELRFDENGFLFLAPDGKTHRITILYRFFELFDLPNIPKSDLMLYFAKGGRVRITPPVKPWLEEKAGMALWHHPALREHWSREIAPERVALLDRLIPPTWVMDPAPVPAQASLLLPLVAGERRLRDFGGLLGLTQRERRFIIKPSGFSPLAWGSRGVVVGHDLPEESWKESVLHALESFSQGPSILQPFRQTHVFPLTGYDFSSETEREEGYRIRVCPYYFVSGKNQDEVRTGGVLVTACPKDKKLIHGMVDAILSPAWPPSPGEDLSGSADRMKG